MEEFAVMVERMAGVADKANVNAVFGERDQARVIPEEALVPQGNRQFVIKLKPGADKETMVAQRVDVGDGLVEVAPCLGSGREAAGDCLARGIESRGKAGSPRPGTFRILADRSLGASLASPHGGIPS